MGNESNRRYAAMEISSKTVKLIYGYVQDDLVYVLHALETNVNAVESGVVVESEALTSAIKGLINTANENLNIQIKEVLLALPPMGLNFTNERAMSNTISSDSIVAQLDINNCISILMKTKVKDMTEIIDVIPYQYILETNETLTDSPICKRSRNINVLGTVYSMDKLFVEGYVKAVTNAGLIVKKVVPAPLASALYLSNCDQIANSCSSYYLLNIGSNITTLSQINQKIMITKNKCFRFGGDVLTEKLQQKFNLSMKDAKMLKEKYGIDKSPSFKVKVFNDLTMSDIGDCIKENILPVIESLKQQISNWSGTENKYLPIVLVGGGTSLYGLRELLEKNLQLTVIDVIPYSFGARNKSYENCLGLIKYADKYIQTEEDDPFISTSISRVPQKEVLRSSGQHYDINEEL